MITCSQFNGKSLPLLKFKLLLHCMKSYFIKQRLDQPLPISEDNDTSAEANKDEALETRLLRISVVLRSAD